jgi:integrase/recombinase XerD
VAGRRDFAILTMLVRLGMRSGEVAGLGLDDVDWRTGELVVVGKGRRAERLPVPVDVGEAVAAYLRDGRPASAQDRSLFVRVKAPHRGLTKGGVTPVVVAAARRASLDQIHAHRLRHTAATAQGAGAAVARSTVMTALQEHLAGDLAVRRALGYKLARAEKLLGLPSLAG